MIDDICLTLYDHILDSSLNITQLLYVCVEVVVANTFLPLLLPHAQKVLVLDGNGGVECEGPPAQAQAESAWLQEARNWSSSMMVY